MENKVPTAEEWLDSLPLQTLTDELKEDIKDTFYQEMIEFAKLHVEQALECASENVGLSYKNSILNAYPLDLIK